ncbi:MAG: mycofactocin-associated electron transfer flavoprotein alpha subunit [Acidimicrobiales bacterium]
MAIPAAPPDRGTAALPAAGAVAQAAVLVVRDGRLPAGADAVLRGATMAVLVGSGVDRAAAALTLPIAKGPGSAPLPVYGWEAGPYQPERWVPRLAPLLQAVTLLCLPDGPDGRELGPLLAHRLRRPYLANVLAAGNGAVRCVAGGATEVLAIDTPAVALVRVAHRAGRTATGETVAASGATAARVRWLDLDGPAVAAASGSTLGAVQRLGEIEPDVGTMDLADAERVVGAGAGLDGPHRLEQLAGVGRLLGAALGATRVLTDRGWAGHERQIGTTGVAIDPRLYLAFGISGAVQHTSGLGRPDHVVAVNTDPSCPMMAMADLAVVADAAAVIEALAERLSTR